MRTLRILMVEDSPSDQKLIAAELRRSGLQFDAARVETPEEMRAALAEPWDIVLSDWSMPQFSALAALALLHELQLDLPFIIVSGTVGEEAAVEAMRAGANDYVLKDKLLRLRPAIERELRDVEARRAAQEAQRQLQLQEARFRSLIEHSSDGITLTSRDGRLSYATPSMARMFRYATTDEIVGKSVMELIHPDDRPRVAANMAELRSTPRLTQRQEVRVFRGDGTLCWIEILTTNLLDEPGVGAIVGNVRDITLHVEALERLRASEVRYREIVETTGEGVWIVDPSGTISFANTRMATMLGISPDALVGQPLARFADEALRMHVDAGSRGDGTSHRQVDATFRCPAGRTLHCIVETSVLRDARGAYEGTLGMVLDVTDRHRAEAALRASERRVSRLLESGIVGIAFVDLDGAVEEANDTYLRMVGYTRADLEARAISWRAMLASGNEASNEAIERKLLETGVADPFERELSRKDGTRFPALCGVAVVDFPKLVVFVVDLSAQKRAEVALERTEEQLRHAQKLEAIGRLAGGVAHDFNNVLTVILSTAEMVLDESAISATTRDDVQEIKLAGLRAAALTKQLLMFSRHQVLTLVVFDLNELLHGMERMIRRLLGEDVELRTNLDPAIGRIRADRGQIEQVVMNLIVNARDAMPRGGVLTLETSMIEVGADQVREGEDVTAGTYVALTVTDTGSGIDASVLPRIFEPFFTTKETGKGTGLGLSTAFGIVRSNRGVISVDSRPGEGTSFRVMLPRVEAAVDQIRPVKPVETLRGTETILLVEDEEQVRSVTTAILRRAGYRVLIAGTPAEALRLVLAEGPHVDLVLTDVVMPGMSGPSLAAEIAARYPRARVIYMSGYVDDTVIRHGLLGDGRTFVQKPITPEPLLRTIRSVLDAGES